MKNIGVYMITKNQILLDQHLRKESTKIIRMEKLYVVEMIAVASLNLVGGEDRRYE